MCVNQSVENQSTHNPTFSAKIFTPAVFHRRKIFPSTKCRPPSSHGSNSNPRGPQIRPPPHTGNPHTRGKNGSFLPSSHKKTVWWCPCSVPPRVDFGVLLPSLTAAPMDRTRLRKVFPFARAPGQEFSPKSSNRFSPLKSDILPRARKSLPGSLRAQVPF